MKNISKFKLDKPLILLVISLFTVSLITINSASNMLGIGNDLLIKQILWIVFGFIISYIIMAIGNKYIIKHIWFLYGFGILSLILLLFIAPSINGAKCWFVIPKIGTFQPSEFMKIILILTLSTLINEYNKSEEEKTLMEEFKFLIKILIVVFIPSILTFLQPDTGVVLIYLLITAIMLFISGIRIRWFLIAIGIFLLIISFVLILFFYNQELFIKLLGTNFFLRVDRLLDWSSKSGFQLENGLFSIGSGGLLGHGINNTPLYFPEGQTDFIFAVFASNFGFIGSLGLIILIAAFDLKILKIARQSKRTISKYIISGILGMLIYQQIQNIGMTFGLLPITGITLPFISYGGSSLLSYMIILGIILNISNETMRYTN